MEFVPGEPITEYCDRHRWSIRQRLDLLERVCQAVQHAHTKGLIHRDIKPSNILVADAVGSESAPTVKIIDFGIAKAIHHRLSDATIATGLHQFIGTPAYMSPEQADASPDIDTRTDVYSLGVLLYELLTGATPFEPRELRAAALQEVQRLIREVEPPKPSTRLATKGAGPAGATSIASVAACRRTEPGKLVPLLRGELDWIVMKALEKDRSRRYHTASELAGDLQRYLANQPVSAAPPSRAYRALKFVRRNRALVTAGMLFAAALGIGAVGTTIGFVRARAERDRAWQAEQTAEGRRAEAERARDEAQKAHAAAERDRKIAVTVTDFYTRRVFGGLADQPRLADMPLREMLERGAAAIDQRFKGDDPAIEGDIRERMGQLFLNISQPRRAAQFLLPAADLLEKGYGPDHRFALAARHRVGNLLLELERFDEAERAFDATYAARRRVLGEGDQFTINSLKHRGLARVHAGRTEAGLADIRAAAEMFDKLPNRDDAMPITTLELADALVLAGRHEEGERVAREFLAAFRGEPGALEWAGRQFRCVIAKSLLGRSRHAEALDELDAVADAWERNESPDDVSLMEFRSTRARAMMGLGRHAEALPILAACYEVLVVPYGAEAPRCRALAADAARAAEAIGDASAATWRARR